MMNLLRAEWHKITHHHLLMLFTLGVFPVGAAVLLGLQWLIYFAVAGARDTLEVQSLMQDMLTPWVNLTAAQGAVFRLLPLAFIASVFAGDYAAGTWKVILPGQKRWALLAVWALVAVVGNGLPLTALGQSYFPAWGSTALQEGLRQLGVEMGLAVLMLLFLVALSGLVATLTRATMPAVGIGVLFSLLESITPVFLLLGNGLFDLRDQAGFLSLWQYLPSYAVLNLREWWLYGQSYTAPFYPGAEYLPAMSALTSLLIFGVWIGVCGAGAVIIFQRQDITV